MKTVIEKNMYKMAITNSSLIKKLFLLFLVFAGLYFAKDFLMPFVIGTVMATLFLPLCRWLEEKKTRRGLAATLCLLILISGLAGIAAMLGWQISELINDIALIKLRIIETSHRIQEYIFQHLGITLEKQTQILKKEQPSFTGIMQIMAGSLTSFFTNFILTLVYIFCLLYYRSHIKEFLLKLSPQSQKNEMEKIIYSVANVSQQYLLGLSKMIVLLWLMYGIGFSIIGVKNAIFFAVLCGLLEIVPFIGNITGTSITVLVAAVHGDSLPVLVAIVSVYLLVQFIQGWILEPLIVGSQVKINPLFTIISLIIGELVWGIPGIFLAIPIIAMFKIICDHIESMTPYGFLIGEIEMGKKESAIIEKIKNWYKNKRFNRS